MVLMAIGVSGLYSLSVIQTRQSTRLEQLLPANELTSINPVSGSSTQEAAWAKKLGVYAEIASNAVDPPVTPQPLNHGFMQIIDNEDSTGFVTYQELGGDDWEEYGGHPGDNELNVAEIETLASYGSYALFYFTNVPPGDYELYTYVPTKNGAYPGEFGSAVPHQIYCGGYLATVNVDQRSIEQDLEYNGKWWEQLGVFTCTAGTVYIVIRDAPVTGRWLVADAMLLRSRRSFEIITPVSTTSADGASVTVELN